MAGGQLGSRAGGRSRIALRPAAFSSRAAPVSQPLPLWILYPLFFVAVYLLHAKLLKLPYFWDEAGYYIPAALDFFRTGTLIPHSTVSNAHPPLPSMLLAGWWQLAGTSISGTRTFLCMVAAAALLGLFRLARQLAGSAVAAAVCGMTLLYPVWFAQASMAHADLFAAAFTLWALSYALGRYSGLAGFGDAVIAALLFTAAALAKETAIVTPIALGLWEITLLLTERQSEDKTADWSWVPAFFLPVLPLIAWYRYHLAMTGFVFGNPEFLRYNATANLGPLRLLLSLWHRVTHLTLHMNLWVATVVTVAVLLMPRLRASTPALLRKPALAAIAAVLVANTLEFSILGGALLTRYLLPLYPLELLVMVALWQQRMRRWWLLVALTAAAFVAGLFIHPPYGYAPEDNLAYRDFILLHQQAIGVIEQRFPAATVLSAWPATAEMTYPDLGYTPHPIKTVAIDNFSAGQIARAAAEPGDYDTALIFSTKLEPFGRLDLGRLSRGTNARFFDFHRDLSPREVALALHGDIVWQGWRNGEWAAILHFPRIVEAEAR